MNKHTNTVPARLTRAARGIALAGIVGLGGIGGLAPAVAITTAALMPTTTQAAEPTREEKAAFDALVAERNGLVRQLYRLDQQAAAAMLAGKETAKINAEQQTLQDKLNLVEQRLAIQSSRYDLDIPEAPKPSEEKREDITDPKNRQVAIGSLAPDGQARMLQVIENKVKGMLATLKFEGFPQGLESRAR